MRCSSCASENREGRKFCAECGAELTLACGACGAKNRPGERFCGECGKSLAEAKEPTQREPRSYTPTHLADRILAEQAAMESRGLRTASGKRSRPSSPTSKARSR
jgi:predicted amidophosphoribosyltransferase